MAWLAEVYVLVAGLSFTLLGLVALLVSREMAKPPLAFRVMKYTGLLGIVLVPVSFIVALVRGHIGPYVSTMINNPTALFSPSTTYTEGCIGNQCADFCCANPMNPTDTWRDCNQNCSSRAGMFVQGKNTGSNCRFNTKLPLYCGTVSQNTHANNNKCNAVPSLGPITCFCCITQTSKQFYYDCNQSCIGHPSETGFPTSLSKCKTGDPIYCSSNIVTTDTRGVASNTP